MKAKVNFAPASSATRQMAALIRELARGPGFPPSVLPGVRFLRSDRHIPPSPIAYEPSIVIIAQGRKIGRLGERKVIYDPGHYLVLTVPLPFECETFGSPEQPLLGVSIAITPVMIAELLVQMRTEADAASGAPQAFQSAPLDPTIAAPTLRLLEALRTEDEAQILGPQLVREIAYRALRGPLGGNLRALAAPNSHFGQISRVLNRLHTRCEEAYAVEDLAREAGMSLSAFHSHFKAATASSPLQYLKNIRLNRARMLMVTDGLSAASAATRVGYESASQFSREFKRYFGDAPARVARELRANLVQLV